MRLFSTISNSRLGILLLAGMVSLVSVPLLTLKLAAQEHDVINIDL
jgi:hypothetical protein